MQPGWVPPEAGASHAAGGDAITAALAALPIERLCPVGFVFVWADKVVISTCAITATSACHIHKSAQSPAGELHTTD